jgi:DNA-binding transcriptional ArsR family regulator
MELVRPSGVRLTGGFVRTPLLPPMARVMPRSIQRRIAQCLPLAARWLAAIASLIDTCWVIELVNHMVNSRTASLDETFFALSDPTRREMVARLATGDMTVSELAQPFDISPPAISKHLRVLERAGLLRCDRVGRVRRCRLEAPALREAADWVDEYRRFWDDRLDRLAAYLDDRDRQIGDNGPAEGEQQ